MKAADMNSKHALFQKFPLNGTTKLSTGDAPTPYHVYDGYGLFVGGSVEYAVASELLRHEELVPVRTTEGKAMMGIWLCNFGEASLGAHLELQFSIFAAPKPIVDLSPHPLALSAAMITRPDLQMLCHGLWNNTAQVVAYNRELLGLNARLTDGRIGQGQGSFQFAFSDVATGESICAGQMQWVARQPIRAGFALGRLVGFRRLAQNNSQPWFEMNVINPKGVRFEQNLAAPTYTKNDQTFLRYFNPARDQLKITHPLYQRLLFAPYFVQQMAGFKFVYLTPNHQK